MENEKDFLNYVKNEHFGKFQTKAISEYIKEIFGIPKIKVKIWISILKTNKLIIRKSDSGYCKTTCASCYEYGCDAGIKTPINYWVLI
jgi:hypothetical protein